MTEEQKRKELIQEYTKDVSGPIGKLQLLFIVTIFASVFVFIWADSINGWKTLATGLIGTVALGIVNFFLVKHATKIANQVLDKIDEEFEKKKSNSKFHQRLAEMQKQKEASK